MARGPGRRPRWGRRGQCWPLRRDGGDADGDVGRFHSRRPHRPRSRRPRRPGSQSPRLAARMARSRRLRRIRRCCPRPGGGGGHLDDGADGGCLIRRPRCLRCPPRNQTPSRRQAPPLSRSRRRARSPRLLQRPRPARLPQLPRSARLPRPPRPAQPPRPDLLTRPAAQPPPAQPAVRLSRQFWLSRQFRLSRRSGSTGGASARLRLRRAGGWPSASAVLVAARRVDFLAAFTGSVASIWSVRAVRPAAWPLGGGAARGQSVPARPRPRARRRNSFRNWFGGCCRWSLMCSRARCRASGLLLGARSAPFSYAEPAGAGAAKPSVIDGSRPQLPRSSEPVVLRSCSSRWRLISRNRQLSPGHADPSTGARRAPRVRLSHS